MLSYDFKLAYIEKIDRDKYLQSHPLIQPENPSDALEGVKENLLPIVLHEREIMESIDT